MSVTRLRMVWALLALAIVSANGCSLYNTTYGPNLGMWGVPIPVSPYLQKRQEDKFWMKERYERVPVLGPLTAGGPAVALDPPSPDEVMRALEKADSVQSEVPLLHEVQRNNVRMIIEPIADYVDPPRVYPLIGPAQLHHAHYKCTIFYSEVTHNGWPLPYTTVDEDSQEVVYIDHEHFHMVGDVGGAPGLTHASGGLLGGSGLQGGAGGGPGAGCALPGGCAPQ